MKHLRTPRRAVRALVAVALSGAMVLGAGVLTAPSAAAAAPADGQHVPAPGHKAPISQPARVDQCGSQGTEWVPDKGPGFDFTEPCRGHDLCYGKQPYGSNSAGRKACDQEFLRDALKSCAAHNTNDVATTACTKVANSYYRGLRLFGAEAFNRAKNPRVTIRPIEQVHPGSGSGRPVGGGSGPIGGSPAPAPNPSVTIGKLDPVDTASK